VNASERLHRVDTWAGLRRGDPVEVAGTGLRSASWEFVAYVTNVSTGEAWVEVIGGRGGDRMTRSFAPDRIFPPTSSRTVAKSSLAVAPKLPFG